MPDESTPGSTDVTNAINIARRLITAGVPVFAAPPCPTGCPGHTDRHGVHHPHKGGPGQYHLPPHWQKTVPSMVNLDRWQPGWGLAAVGGHVADFLDVDPRNGGDESAAELRGAGHWPRVFSGVVTPSGGRHHMISATGERKGSPAPGIDLQSGDADGVGRGFVWLPPTVRPSKDPADAGTLRAYHWVREPDLEELAEWADTDHSTEGIVARLQAKRSASKDRAAERPAPAAVDPDDPFLTASTVGAGPYGGGDVRSFTQTEAQDFVRPALLRLQAARVGEIEETANVAAATLSHFVPAFWSAEEAFALLLQSLKQTAYDPDGPSDWTAEKFRPVLDGRRPPLDAWKATRKSEPPAPPAVVVEAEPGEESLSVLERLRAKLVTAEELAELPAPEPLVCDLLDLDAEAWLIGAPGSLKSFIALDLAGAVGRGADWQGHRVTRRDVLYVAAEGAGGMVLRTRAYRKIHGSMPGVTFLPYPVQVKSNDGQWDALTQISRELRPGLIVIDTQARVSVGLEENSATDMGILVAAVGRLRRATGACVLVVHHTGRSGGDARGSSALDGAQDTELKVIRAEPRSSLLCKIVQDKQKDMAEGDGAGIPLQLKVVDLGVDERTGRELSSLVVGDYDPFAAAQEIAELDVDTELWRRIPQPQAWTGALVPSNAKVKRRALQVLADHAHQRGLTKAEALRIVSDRWEAPAKRGHWDAAWADIADLELLVNVGGERWALDQAALEGLRAQAGDTAAT